ncbi:flagellar protein FlgN [Leptospira sp. 96542]|nr:flagellar protein FlgN [Leptospira sp. 96542]
MEKKIDLLCALLINLKEEENLLSYRDSETAVKIEFKNEPILRKLEELDRMLYERQEMGVYSALEIEISERVFSLLDEARLVQQKVQKMLEFEMNESKKDLWEFRIKRKLKNHFFQSSGLSWTKNYC